MFSMIFGKKKTSPDDDNPIPGPDPVGSNPSDRNEFVFIDRKDNPSPANAGGGGAALYPPMPGMPYPPAPTAAHHHPYRQQSFTKGPAHFLDGVPFQLAPELCKEDTLEIIQLEVDGILALMTKRLQIDETEYDFALEREISQQQ